MATHHDQDWWTTFGRRCRAARLAARRSQQDVATMLGIFRESYTLVEAGRRQMTACELALFVTLLDVTSDYLLFGD